MFILDGQAKIGFILVNVNKITGEKQDKGQA